MGLKVLVTGGRKYGWFRRAPFEYGPEIVDGAAVGLLFETLDGTGCTELCHGGARGADSWAGEWAKTRNIPCRVFRADWKLDGRAAGPIRNRRMLREFQPELVVAFPGGKGTADMVAIAEAAGIPVLKVVR